MKKPFGGIVLDTAFRLIVPFSLVYGVYVLIFGEAGPGGGFQAGALLSIGVVLSRLIMGDQASFNISIKNSLVLAGVGTFIYAATGWQCLTAAISWITVICRLKQSIPTSCMLWGFYLLRSG